MVRMVQTSFQSGFSGPSPEPGQPNGAPIGGSPGARVRRTPGFSLIELLVVVAVIMILAALLFPALRGAQGRAYAVQCLSNMRQLTVAHINYAADHDGELLSSNKYLARDGWNDPEKPIPTTSVLVLEGYVPNNRRLFMCPMDDGVRREPAPWRIIYPATFSYTRNGYIRFSGGSGKVLMTDPARAAKTTLLFEEWEFSPMNDGFIIPNQWDKLTQRHSGKANMSFFDGHVSAVDAIEYNEAPSIWQITHYLWPD
jgi:prepilin-type processing-associated H-X9-DG protein/prepilin-type N-terminal cleavage/methylation domain-containing protein